MRTENFLGFDMSTPDKAVPQLQSLAGVRLHRHADYQRAYDVARKRQSSSMSWYLAPQSQTDVAIALPTGPRVGLTVGKVLGPAHDRNCIKRRMREALRRHIELLPAGFDLIIHPRRIVLTLEFVKLEAEIVRILEQADTEACRIRKQLLVAGTVQAGPQA
jgi:ribonuclease P protein component